MANYIAILEDDPIRVREMRAGLAEILPACEPRIFDNASEMIAWLGGNLRWVHLISLDHDLPLVQQREGHLVDAGTGRMVADYLAAIPPTCPVIVHSSNDVFAQGMARVLKDGGWPCSRVYPFGDYEWIGKSWLVQIREYIRDRWIVVGGVAGPVRPRPS